MQAVLAMLAPELQAFARFRAQSVLCRSPDCSPKIESREKGLPEAFPSGNPFQRRMNQDSKLVLWSIYFDFLRSNSCGAR
jgi:hypothetical protein